MNEAMKMMETIQSCVKAADLSTLDEKRLLLAFHERVWSQLSSEGRLLVLQEVENRRAKLDGRPPLKVISNLSMQPYHFGGWIIENGKEYIQINPRLVLNSKLFHKIDTSVFNAAHALSTVLHEGRHGFQHHAVYDNFANVPERQRLEWAAVKNCYFREPFYCYFMQSIEVDARRFARRKVAQVNKYFNSLGLPDPNFTLQIDKDVQKETELIDYIRKNVTREEIDKIEQRVLEQFRKMHPKLDLKELRVLDHVRFILDHPEIKDAKEMLERLDRLADEKMGLLHDDKHLNRLREPSLSGLKS